MNDAHETIDQFLERFRQAWDSGDARAYAALFAEDATYVIFLGEALVGQAEIEANHVEVFARWQSGAKMAVKAINVRALSPEIASVLTVGGIGSRSPIVCDKLQTFTLVRRGDRWLCAAFQNTAMSRQSLATMKT